ncbi:MAG: MBL fold metallo-hydrolase [bacterium]
MNKEMTKWGVGPKFALISVIYGIIIFILHFVYYPSLTFEVISGSVNVILGIILLILGVPIFLIPAFTIDKYFYEGKLYKSGIYSFFRHPIYAAWIVFIVPGIVLIFGSLLGISIPLFMYLVFRILIVKEEKYLERKFGQDYLHYKKEVPCLFPRIEFAIAELFVWIASLPSKTWYPVETGKLTEGLYVIKDRDANLFIYSDRENTICIDAGYKYDDLRNEFRKINIDPDSITHLFLTHADPDHAGGVDFFGKFDLFKGAKLYIGKEEEQMINGTTARLFFAHNPVKIYKKYNLLKDKDVVNVGKIKVEAIATPGHTPGHMAYLINDKILCSGDTLTLKDGKVEIFSPFHNIDTETQKESIKKLAELENISILCTAHTGYSQSYKNAMQQWLK